MIIGTIRGQVLTIKKSIIASDTLNYLTAQFSFTTPDWDGLVKVAHFSNKEDSADIELTNGCILEADGLNLTAGKWQVSISGHKVVDGEVVKRATTTICEFIVLPSIVPAGEPLPSLPSYGEQILGEVQEVRTDLAGIQEEVEEIQEKIVTDKTLSLEDTAADAKIVGNDLAPAYDSSLTYKAKDYVLYQGDIYICVTDINTPEEWNPVHWASATLGGGLSSISSDMDLLYKILIGREITPKELQLIVQSGHADRYLSVGDVIYIPWTITTNESVTANFTFPAVVTDFVTAEDEQGNTYPNAVALMWLYALPLNLPFDSPEDFPCPEGTVIEEGYYYYTLGDSSYDQLDPQPMVGSTVPEGETYYKHDLPSAGGAIGAGLNDWRWSAIRQWLNSDAGYGEGWWTSQHPCDKEPQVPNFLSSTGFVNGFDEEWRPLFKPVKVLSCRNNLIFGDEVSTTYDTFFLPSIVQVYGDTFNSRQQEIEGPSWQYWSDRVGTVAPTNNYCADRIITAMNNPYGRGVGIGLRSAHLNYPYYTYLITDLGAISNFSPNVTIHITPACIIY